MHCLTYKLMYSSNHVLHVHVYFTFSLRITPVETLHTILLGCCKYVLKSFMTGKSSLEKRDFSSC